ncbi:hypothetical protein HK098_001287 [Nowakowskiella sp. JEL0407]|nr:hypothetical protein HK098_001287 [Nowakowskiella sp. JEL0407]
MESESNHRSTPHTSPQKPPNLENLSSLTTLKSSLLNLASTPQGSLLLSTTASTQGSLSTPQFSTIAEPTYEKFENKEYPEKPTIEIKTSKVTLTESQENFKDLETFSTKSEVDIGNIVIGSLDDFENVHDSKPNPIYAKWTNLPSLPTTIQQKEISIDTSDTPDSHSTSSLDSFESEDRDTITPLPNLTAKHAIQPIQSIQDNLNIQNSRDISIPINEQKGKLKYFFQPENYGTASTSSAGNNTSSSTSNHNLPERDDTATTKNESGGPFKNLKALSSMFKKLIVSDEKFDKSDHAVGSGAAGGFGSESKVGEKSLTGNVFSRFLKDKGGNNKVGGGGGGVKNDVKVDGVEEYYSKVEFESKYKILKELGSGGHSTVRLAERTTDSKLVVCKFIKQSSVWHWHHLSPAKKIPLEIHILKLLSSQNQPGIIQFFEYFEVSQGKYIIVMEYLGEEWVDFYDYIEMFGPVDEGEAKEIFRKTVDVVLFLHKLGYCHNDIKDENILINTKTREIKLIDFGSATKIQSGKQCTLFYGTKKFAAPEAIQGDSYYPESQEVWALGALLYVTLFKMDPFKNDEEIVELDLSRRIDRLRHLGKVNGGANISDDAKDAICEMMRKDWRERIAIEDIKTLRFMRD